MKKISVVVDGLVFENVNQVGIWRMFYEVMNRLSDQINFTLWLQAPAVMPLPQGVKILQKYSRWWGSWRYVGKRIFAEWARRTGPPTILQNSDIFHSTYYTKSPNNYLATVTTVYDLIPEFECWDYILGAKKKSIDEASVCVCISETVGKEFQTFYPATTKKLKVISLGRQHIKESQNKTLYSNQSALYVGNRNGYKNFLIIVKALSDQKWPTGLRIKVVGKTFSDNEWNIIDYFGVREKLVELGRISDIQLSAELANSICLIFPSKLEGFGLPILEAQINRCPVVCSDIPVFREVGGNAAVFFEPYSSRQLTDAVSLVSTQFYREQYKMLADANVQRFCWNKTAQEYLDVYHQVFIAKKKTTK